MPHLLVNPGTASEWMLPLKPGVNTVGRSAGSDVQIEHASISGTHCELTVAGDSLVVKDLGSTNGTFIAGAPVTEATVAPGQRLQCGSVALQFLADTPAPTSASSRAAPVVRLAATPAPAPVTSSATAAPAPALAPSRLHMTAHESAPAPPPPPPPMLADEYSLPLEGLAMCKYHPKSQAGWLCTKCQLNFCDLCVSTRPGGARTGKFCRRCSAECVARQIQLVPEGATGGNFFSQAPGAFLFPFEGAGIFMLVIGALGMAVLDLLSVVGFGIRGIAVRLVFRVSVIGYIYAYMQKVIQVTAQGDEKPPDWPDVSEFWGDIVVPFLQLTGVVIACFGPASGMYIWLSGDVAAGANPPVWKGIVTLLALVGGAGYFPMALLAMAMFDSVAAINPLVVIPAIIKAPLEYLVVLLVEFTIIGVLVAKSFLLPIILPIPIVPNLVGAGLAFYLFTVQVRLLGLLYHARRHELGWFTRT